MLGVLRQRAAKHFFHKTLLLRNKFQDSPQLTEFYFGFGANLSDEGFKKRKMFVEEIGNGILRGYQLKFTLPNEYLGMGYAGIHKATGHDVYGVLYRMDKHSLKLLDTLEWAGFGAYERKQIEVELENGDKINAWCYFVKSPRYHLLPSKQYLQKVIESAQKRSFPRSYIDYLKAHSFKESFEIDHTFSLLFYGKKRRFYHILKPLYRIHDQWREKICRWL